MKIINRSGTRVTAAGAPTLAVLLALAGLCVGSVVGVSGCAGKSKVQAGSSRRNADGSAYFEGRMTPKGERGKAANAAPIAPQHR